MTVRFHPHARERMKERGATKAEVIATVEQGERFPAKYRRYGFRRNFPFGGTWRAAGTRPSRWRCWLWKKGAIGWSSP
jgi:hypothetical protein